MDEYKRIETSPEVWAVIHARHRSELKVFATYSAPGGDQFGDPRKGKMFTSYGFEKGDFPVMEAETIWDINPEKEYERFNEKHKYWLCLPIKEDL
jgi:hypothetical protein